MYATTAGHCGSGTYFNDGQVVGSTSALRRDTQTDAQIIPANVQGIIYNGGLDDFNHVIVGWYYTSQVTEAAYNVCAGGRNFGQRCGSRVYLTNQCITYAQGYTTCGQIIAQQSAGNFPGTFGDSGGPVYTSYSDGNAIARGLITGGYSPNLTLWSYAPVDRIQGGFGGAPLGFG